MKPYPKIHIIAGPTASGKSALALTLAKERRGVIINADAMQVYRELRILTARPSEEEEAQAPHRLYGCISVSEACSAGRWLEMVKPEIDAAHAQGLLPIITGGTGMYIQCLMEGISEIPPISDETRAFVQSLWDESGKPGFHLELQKVSPEDAARLRPSDKQRMMRAYEVWKETGKSLTWWQSQGKTAFYPRESFEMTLTTHLPRAELYRRCDARFLKMLADGAMEEVKNLLTLIPALNIIPAKAGISGNKGSNSPLPALRVVGIPELSAHLRGEIPLEEATAKAQQSTRNYAKRQLTWMRNQFEKQ